MTYYDLSETLSPTHSLTHGTGNVKVLQWTYTFLWIHKQEASARNS